MIKRKSIRTGLVLLVTLAGLESARASFHETQPGNKITSSDAVKLSADGKPLFRCRKVKVGPSLNPVAVKGTKYTFHSAVGEGMKGAAAALADGKKIFRCEQVEIDEETARVRKAAEGEE